MILDPIELEKGKRDEKRMMGHRNIELIPPLLRDHGTTTDKEYVCGYVL